MDDMSIKIRYIIFFITVFALTVNAQTVRVQMSPNISVPSSNWDNKKLVEIRKSLEDCLTDYVKYGSLFDEQKKKVTSNSIDNFHKLFFPGAKLVKDFVEHIPAERISIREYSSSVYNLLQMYGVQFKIEEAIIEEIRYDPAGFYVPVVKIEKSIYNYVKSSGKVEVISGRFFTQYFHFDVSVTNLSKVKITDIKGKDIVPPEEFTQILGFQAGAFMPLVNASKSDLWQDAHQNIPVDHQLTSNGAISLKGGLLFKSNQIINPRNAKNKRLFWSIGAGFSLNRIENNLSNFGFSGLDTSATDPNSLVEVQYQRMAYDINLKETLQFGTLEVPVGVSYRLIKKRMMSVFIDAHFLPAFTMINSGSSKGLGTYDGVIEEWRFLKDNATNPSVIQTDDGLGPFEVGDSVVIRKDGYNFSTNFFSYGVRVSPVIYWDLTDYNPNWGVKAGIDVTYNLKNPLKATNSQKEMLRYSHDINDSVLLNYSKNVNFLPVGFYIGLYYRIDKEP